MRWRPRFRTCSWKLRRCRKMPRARTLASLKAWRICSTRRAWACFERSKAKCGMLQVTVPTSLAAPNCYSSKQARSSACASVHFIDSQRSALVTFKKTHTSAKIVTRLVSQAQYSVRLLHGQHEALKPPRSQAEILGLPDIYELPRTASSPKRSSRSAANPRSSASETGAGDKHGAHAHDHTDAERYCNARAAFVLSGAHSNGVRVDELIRTWLRDRRKIQQQLEKKLKDQLRADRDFLKQLQVASGKKDEEVPALCPLPSRILFGAIIHHLMLSSDRHHGPQAEVSDEATNTH